LKHSNDFKIPLDPAWTHANTGVGVAQAV
jgi:hypothetical protein